MHLMRLRLADPFKMPTHRGHHLCRRLFSDRAQQCRAGRQAGAENQSRPQPLRANRVRRRARRVDGSQYSADALLIATGSRYKRLGVPGENDYIGAGVHFCATCDGPFCKGKQVVSAAGEGGSAALMIREYLKGM